MKSTYLYIKQHKVTGLKYFGKTTKSDPIAYLGSGKHWLRHIKKHGTEFVETIWIQLFTDETELVEYAIKFSKENNIVESKEWANLKEENGLDGGFDAGGWSKEQIKNISIKQKGRWAKGVYDREKLRLSRIGFKQPEKQKIKVSEKLSKEWAVTNPNGQKQIVKNLHKFCKNNNLDQGNMVKVSQGILKQHKGWKCVKVVS
jgi:hypothetical protein